LKNERKKVIFTRKGWWEEFLHNSLFREELFSVFSHVQLLLPDIFNHNKALFHDSVERCVIPYFFDAD
jgi:hypothetical protein